MEIRLLGEVSASSDDGRPLDLGPVKVRTVLAALALSADAPVPMWRLVESVWGDDPPRTAERTIQSYIARLRKELGSETIARTTAGYQLNVDADSIDVHRFERLLDSGDVEAALEEWSGEPLAGLDAPGLTGVVVKLTEAWLGALEGDLRRRVDVEPAKTVGRLTELTTAYPFREGLWALLMLALYRVGRQADALAAYRNARAQLVEQLGVEPGPRLRELEMQILSHSDELRSDRPAQPTGRPTGTVTFAFLDVVDAPRLWADHDDAMAASVARLHGLVDTLVAHHDGHVFVRSGDSFGAAFSGTAPAVAWAGDLHDALSAESWPSGLALGACVGLHTGEAEEHGDGYFGPAVNTAARLAAAGHAGQTLLSDTTRNLLGAFEVKEIGWYRLEGVVGEQHLFQLGSQNYPALLLEDLYRGNLPGRLGRLIGRRSELETILGALTDHPVVTLVGPGGIGKTRLAIAAAESVAESGDAWLIDLAAIESADQVPTALAETLGVGERSGESLAQSVVEALRARRTILVLDNCEHVIDAAADIAQVIAQNCAQVRVIATSRQRLGVTNERIISVPPLETTGPAVELFNQRALAASVAFDPDAMRPSVEEICRRLDGIPLAIELAAARTASVSPDALVERLDDRLTMVEGTRRTGTDRHRTLRSTIRWSYDLLDPSDQRLFRRLSVFTGSFDSAAARHALPTDEPLDVDVGLTRLAEQSMLAVESGPFGRRFRLLEPIREFAREQLDESERSDLSGRHARWCLTEATGIQQLLAGWGELEGVARLEELWPNLRAAVDWAIDSGDDALGRALVRPILSEIVLRSNYEIGDWIERLLAITAPHDDEALVFGLYWAAHRYSVSQDPKAYQRLVDRFGEPDHVFTRHGRATAENDYRAMAESAPEAVVELRRRGDDLLADRAEINIATAWLNLARYPECDARLTELLDRYRTQGPPTFVNWTLLLLGYSASFQGAHDRADSYFDQAIAVQVPPGTHTPNKPLEARAAFKRGNHLRAFRTLGSHISEILATDNMQVGSIACIEFINMTTQLGRHDEAATMLAYLETTGMLDNPAWRSLVLDSSETLASTGSHPAGGDPIRDHRQALEYMRDALEQFADSRHLG